MSIFTGSELIAMAAFDLVATPAGGGATYALANVRTAGCSLGTPVDHAPTPYVEIPVTLDESLTNRQQINIVSPHYSPTDSPLPFVVVVAGAAVPTAIGNVGTSSNLIINYNPAAFPLAVEGRVEFHYVVFKFPEGVVH